MAAVIALAIALTALSAALTAAVIACGKWLHDANEEKDNLRDTLTANDAVSDSYMYERDRAIQERDTAREQFRLEHNLRTIAETQRNSAQERVRELLRKHLRNATDDEIRDATADAFASPLSLVPKQPEAPASRRPGADDLINPFEPVQPAGPTR